MDTSANVPPLHDRALVPLLTAITILLAVLVIGLGIGAIAAMRAVHEARAQIAQLTGGQDGGDTKEKAKALAADVVQRQQSVAQQLRAEATGAEQKLQGFQVRLKQLYPVTQGFTRKIDQTIALMQLMNDQMILMNHQLAALQQTAAQGLRPMDAERPLAPQTGTGGSGEGKGVRKDERRRGDKRQPPAQR